MSLENQTIVKSGETFEISGFYCYDGHISKNGEECFVPDPSYLKYFKKGDVGSKLGSCPHDINWILISAQ